MLTSFLHINIYVCIRSCITLRRVAGKQLAKMVVEEYGKSSLNILDEAGADQSLAGQKGSNHKNY
jgi:hypothetical protein